MAHETFERRLVAPAVGASYYDTSLRTFRRMIATGQITAYRLPGSRLLRVDLNELDDKLRPIPTVGTAA
jgi:excisionase family DNA binding protein